MIADLYNKLVAKFSTGAYAIDTGLHDWYTTDDNKVHAWFMLESKIDVLQTQQRITEQLDCDVTVDSVQYNAHYVLTPKD